MKVFSCKNSTTLLPTLASSCTELNFVTILLFFKVSYVHIRNKKKIREHAISGIKNVMSRELQECHKHELNIQAVGQGLNSGTGGMINLVVSFHSMLS